MMANTLFSPPKLSSREMDVLRLAANGKTQAEIARELFISPDTAKARNKTLREKLDAPTITNAVFKAMRWRLIE